MLICGGERAGMGHTNAATRRDAAGNAFAALLTSIVSPFSW